MLLSLPHTVFAEEKQPFAQWPEKSQVGFIPNSIVMAGYIAAQSDKKLSDCIADWYLASDEITDQRNNEISERIDKYPDYHPASVILASLEKACWKFPRS